ncbi:N,N-dimethylformamidase beta subunit family domain-containing protein [Iamia sp.]|uniref:N,N-dimethylformamidase beta subunit family domain-containing protein n=1 Tax=Iamia sp. TaxID=2722710 RepID=UPI002B746366|nr:N,N-dimethylformamidase beta subunit family domain-containing protein [Iamia sp.]HXH57026.1 N,N-dimethylformamidase beta subunit family domain-containing protein [Iamia sp.]
MAFETVTGYCWPQSVAGGARVGLHLSSAGGRDVAVEVARVGWQREVVFTDTAVAADHHPTPTGADREGCGWPAALVLDVDRGWRSGYYEVVLDIDVDGSRRRSHAFFVVRPPTGAPAAPILLALSTNTWHAYNDFGGRNLYTGGTAVSLQRPMSPGYLHKPPGAGRRVTTVHIPDPEMAAHRGYLQLNHLSPYAGSAGWPDWELPFLRWAEREGYTIDVVTNADLEDHPGLLAGPGDGGYSLFLSVGHDEYWSSPMRDTVEGFIGRGGHAAFLSGNTSFWQVRLEDPSPEGPAATMVSYKGRFKSDPVYGTDRVGELTSMWSDELIGRPENLMTGVSFARGGYHRIGRRATRGAGGYTVHRPDHWLLADTGLGYGDLLGAESTTVGYECDGCDFTYRDGLPHPTGVDGTPMDFTILGTAPAPHFTRETATRPPPPDEPSEVEFIAARVAGGGRTPGDVARVAHGHAVLGTYTSPAGGIVVTSGSTDWAHGLAGHDEPVEQITRNLLDRLAGPPAD